MYTHTHMHTHMHTHRDHIVFRGKQPSNIQMDSGCNSSTVVRYGSKPHRITGALILLSERDVSEGLQREQRTILRSVLLQL